MKSRKILISLLSIICVASLVGCTSVEGKEAVTIPAIESVISTKSEESTEKAEKAEVDETVATEEVNEIVIEGEVAKVYTKEEALNYLERCSNADTAVYHYYDELVYYLSNEELDSLKKLILESDVDVNKNPFDADFSSTLHMFDKEGNYVYVIAVNLDKKTTYFEPGEIKNESLTAFIMSFYDKATKVGFSEGLDITNLVNSFKNTDLADDFYELFYTLSYGQYREEDTVIELSPLQINLVKSTYCDLKMEPYDEAKQTEYSNILKDADRLVVLSDATNESAIVDYTSWIYSIPESEYYYLVFDSFMENKTSRYVFRFTDSQGRLERLFSKLQEE